MNTKIIHSYIATLDIKKLIKISSTILLITLLTFSYRVFQLSTMAEETSKQKELRKNSICTEAEWKAVATKDKCLQASRTEAHKLFDALTKSTADLIKIKPNGAIELPASDYLLSYEARGSIPEESTRLLLERLYGSVSGKAVQQQVAWWNHSRYFSAIRDDFPQQGELSSEWIAHDRWKGVLQGYAVVPLSYGYVNAGKLPQYFNNWLSVSGEGRVDFKREFKVASRQTLRIQMIGKPDLAHSNLPANTRLQACELKKVKKKTEVNCHTVKGSIPEVQMYRLFITLTAGKKHELTIALHPASNNELKIDGLPIHLLKTSVKGAYKPTDLAWEPLFEYKGTGVPEKRKQFRFKIVTSDGILLFDSQDNYPTDFTRDYGLLALIGYDDNDRLALAGMVSRAKLKSDNVEVRLTLNQTLQKLAYQHLQRELKTIDPHGKYKDRRRAAVVLLNPQTGAILATANYPNPPNHVHRWDRLSYSKLYPTRDPFGVPAWQGLDNNNTPGSVFKMVTALAGLQVAEEGRDDIRSLIRGLNASEYKQLTGLAVTKFSYDPDGIADKIGGKLNPESKTSTIKNSGNALLLSAMPHGAKNKKTGKTVIIKPRLRSNGCVSKIPTSHNLGLREGVRDSLNVWFARMGVMMDKDNLMSGGKDTKLVAMADRLGFDKADQKGAGKFSLAQKGSPLNMDGKLTHHKGRGTVLSAFTGNLTLKTQANSQYALGDSLQRLAQNSFGQGVTTTPLQIARVASTVATGYRPDPYLLERWGGENLETPERLKLQPENIELLKQGMKAVPEVSTAAKAFAKYYPKGRCRVYGKTGTAQIARGGKIKDRLSYYSAWFTGWREDKTGKPDIAFACMVTHTYRSGHEYGGDACGPIVARILRDLDKKNKTEVKQ